MRDDTAPCGGGTQLNASGSRHSNRLSCLIIDEARRTFEEDVDRVLEDIELAKRLQRVVAAVFHRAGGLLAPTPRQPPSFLWRPDGTGLAGQTGPQTLGGSLPHLVAPGPLS